MYALSFVPPWLYSTHSFFISADAGAAANTTAVATAAGSRRSIIKPSLGLRILRKSRAAKRRSPGVLRMNRRSALDGAPPPEIATLRAHVLRQHHLVHLIGAVDEPRLPGVSVDPFEHGVLGIAARAIELDRGVGGVMQRVGHMHLGHRHFLAGAVALIE